MHNHLRSVLLESLPTDEHDSTSDLPMLLKVALAFPKWQARKEVKRLEGP